MTSRFRASITLDAGPKTRAIYESVKADDDFYPDNPVKTDMRMDKELHIDTESDSLAHLRANLNSTLRLVRACEEAIDSASG